MGTPLFAPLIGLGILAGLLTSLAGQGGGLFLLLVLSALYTPHVALVLTTPALLFGNIHRSVMGREEIDRPIARRLALAVIPGSLLGGTVAGQIPGRAISVILLGMVVLSFLKVRGVLRFDLSPRMMLVLGFFVGVLTGASGGAGVLMGPILLSLGLTGMRYVATNSAIAVAIHIGRVAAYGAAGMFRWELVLPIVVLTFAIFTGNFLSKAIRPRMSIPMVSRLEWGTLLVCALISIVGVVR